MKLTKAKLQEIIKEEIESQAGSWSLPAADREEAAAHPWAVAYKNLVNGVGDLIRSALEKDGLDPDIIRDAVSEAFSKELG